ncbi:MAG: DNA-binding response regulator [Chloroflexi bacterium RBG_16_57_11]|nr:MAG: DNA-binding response regulator [Chloroflexi bacterium RBG_16_57_11]
MTGPHILVIDDEPQILRALRTILSAHKYRVTIAQTGEEGLALAAAEHPDIIILDLGLPDMDGITVCAHLREWTEIPIIILSVRNQEQDKVKALDKGADDYLVKPFGIEELLARIRVALRHLAKSQGDHETVITSGPIEIDLARHIVTLDGAEVKLTATEFKLLAYLASHTGRVLTHQNILSNVWGPEYLENVEYLRVFMSQLRKKLETDPKQPRYLLSEPGVGYRFVTED